MVAHLRLVMLRAVHFLCWRARGMTGGSGMASMRVPYELTCAVSHRSLLHIYTFVVCENLESGGRSEKS